jgi:hypothetical protein
MENIPDIPLTYQINSKTCFSKFELKLKIICYTLAKAKIKIKTSLKIYSSIEKKSIQLRK